MSSRTVNQCLENKLGSGENDGNASKAAALGAVLLYKTELGFIRFQVKTNSSQLTTDKWQI